MSYDNIEALIVETLKAIEQGNTPAAFALLGEVKGICGAVLEYVNKWDFIQEGYESGNRPRMLARQHGVRAREITDRAHRENWMSPGKIKKQMKPQKKQVFYPDCMFCEKPFEAYSGHAKICPTCKAFKAREV